MGLNLKPGQKGTKQLLKRYGDCLICVRYRYDAVRRRRIKTVELVVDERDCEPPQSRREAARIVGIRIPFADVALRGLVKKAGGTWGPIGKIWRLRSDRARKLGLTGRIVEAGIQK